MTHLIDFILDLFRDPVRAQAFVNDPGQAMRDAGVSNATAAQVQAVAATVAPVALGEGDPVAGLQRAVAAQHGFAPTLASQPTHAPVSSSNAELLSHNDTHLLSPQTTINENHSVNLDFSGFTMGDKTTAQGSGAVAIGGDNSGDIITGEGSALGNNNHVNNGHLNAGPGSVVNLGEGDVIVDPTPPSAGLPSTHPADPGGLHPIDPSVLHPTTWGTSNPIDPSHLQSTTAPHVRDLEHTKLEEADLRSHVDPAPHVPSPHVPLPDPLNPVDPLHIFS